MTRRIVAGLILSVASAAGAQTPDQTARLATLGQAWGFLKYFHPRVATGTINWDSALVAAIPAVKTSRDNAQLNAVIQSWLDGLGDVTPCADVSCFRVVPDSMRQNLDLRWITDGKTLTPELVRRLSRLRDSPHQGSGRYVTFRSTAMFEKDTAFSAPEYPSEEVRILSLFRFWNAARYFFPYMYVNDGDWAAVLREFIPRMIAAKDDREYHLAVVEMTSRVNDAHVGASSAVTNRVFGMRFPAFEARSIDGRLVVWRLTTGAPTDGSGVQVGDVITHIDGEAVSQRRRDHTKYIAAGNSSVFERKLASQMLRSQNDSATYAVERGGQSLTRRVAMAPRPMGAGLPAFPVTELAKVLPDNIGYVNMGNVNLAQVDSVIEIVKNTDGIVMDVRNYPRGTMYRFADFLNPSARSFVTFTFVDSTHPGQVNWLLSPQIAGRTGGNPNHYRGRVAILIDERTQSHAEFTVMALRTAPQNKVIGSQTAGADGNVTFISLPGGIRSLFTGLGVYYPDGRPTQRIGIVPDIEIRPTLEGLRAGRDEVLERAIQYLRTGR